MTDAVEKRFSGVDRAILIQEGGRTRNIDSKNYPFGFNSCAFIAGRRLFQQHRPDSDIGWSTTFALVPPPLSQRWLEPYDPMLGGGRKRVELEAGPLTQ